jgi:hypothetical protein
MQFVQIHVHVEFLSFEVSNPRVERGIGSKDHEMNRNSDECKLSFAVGESRNTTQ